MNLEMVATSVLVGLIVAWLAGMVVKGGGFGLLRDVMLGVGGSFLGSWIFQALGASPGRVGMVVAAFVGAALVIVAQRKVCPRTPRDVNSPTPWRAPGGCESARRPPPSALTHTWKREVPAPWLAQRRRNCIRSTTAS